MCHTGEKEPQEEWLLVHRGPGGGASTDGQGPASSVAKVGAIVGVQVSGSGVQISSGGTDNV